MVASSPGDATPDRSALNGVKPPRCLTTSTSLTQTVASWSTAWKCRIAWLPTQSAGMVTVIRYQTASRKSTFSIPDSSVSGANGTTIRCCSSRCATPRSRPESDRSISNCHSPFRHSQSGRTNCGRGCSERGCELSGVLGIEGSGEVEGSGRSRQYNVGMNTGKGPWQASDGPWGLWCRPVVLSAALLAWNAQLVNLDLDRDAILTA